MADSPAPAFDTAWFILLATRVVHTASAAVLLGGLVYLKKVVAPLAEGADDTNEALYRGRRGTWAGLVMLTTTLLVFSGFFNLFNIMSAYEKLPMAYHMVFGIKFLLALFVFFVAASTAGKSSAAVKMQSNIQKWLTLAISAALLVFVLGATLRSFPKVPKTMEDVPAAQPQVDGENGQES
ncbi:hypothetical protein NG895_10020 [Aeoliella sp. ICT_H6.2]|uniref:Copper resistance protein D n=1 Tax=Aeoliella straminimaris TaxID=2954799 RepID=A0A9X2F9W6_9BACT|nr:hypothetical protein [Aeoliella straminimaris]MCO6044242.1 hypothetical protein [Aeoliella straminimaris]